MERLPFVGLSFHRLSVTLVSIDKWSTHCTSAFDRRVKSWELVPHSKVWSDFSESAAAAAIQMFGQIKPSAPPIHTYTPQNYHSFSIYMMLLTKYVCTAPITTIKRTLKYSLV